MTEEQIAAVAKSLTKAQREAVMAAGESSWTFLGKATIHPSKARSLVLYHPELAMIDYIKRTNRAAYGKAAIRLTPAGLAVRSYLLRNEPS